LLTKVLVARFTDQLLAVAANIELYATKWRMIAAVCSMIQMICVTEPPAGDEYCGSQFLAGIADAYFCSVNGSATGISQPVART
jgi:hypothetical protein